MDVEQIAKGLSEAQIAALETLPLPHPGDTLRRIAKRPYSSIWRKSAKHRAALEGLEQYGLVERTVSRGETLWRLTREPGLAVRAHLEREAG